LKKSNNIYSIINLKSDVDTDIGDLKTKLKEVQDGTNNVFGDTSIQKENNVKKIKSLYLKNNGTLNILVFHYDNNSYIYTLTGTFDNSIHTLSLDSTNSKKTTIDASEKINSVYVDNSSTGILTNKLKYYQYQKNNATIDEIDLSVAGVGNFTTSKIVNIKNPNTNDYTNIYHFGNAGKIFHYNINNKNKTGLSLYKPPTTEIIPYLTGIDKKGNNIYVINSSDKLFKVKYPNLPPFPQTATPHTDLNGTTLQLSGNTNIHKVDNGSISNAINKENITLLKFDYTPTKNDSANTNDNTKIYSVVKTNKIQLDIANIKLLSKEINIKIDRNKKRNRNEFVSLAVIINDKFKLWLKPENRNDIYEFNYTFSKLDKNDKYELVKYRNGIFMNKYTLNLIETNSTKISNILYEGVNKRFDKNTNTLYLDNIIKEDKYQLLIIPESDKSYIVYNKIQIDNNEEIEIEKTKEKINVGIRNGSLYENHIININYGQLKKITELKDYESQYLLDLLIDEAFEYLNNVNNTDRTLKFLLKKYRLNKKDEVQEFLGLYTDKNKSETIEHKFINELTNNERMDYIKNYLKKDKPKKIEEPVKKEEKKSVETDKVMKDLKVKLDKMKIEKEILANQFKIEQRNRLFEKGQNIVNKEDITKIDTRISDITSMIKESKNNKSKSFLDKIVGFFSNDVEEDKNVEEQLKKIEEAKIRASQEKSEEQIKKLEIQNKLKLEKMERENEIKINKLKEENLITLREQEDIKKQNELLAAQEKNNLLSKTNELELEKTQSKNEENKNKMDDLFNIQKKLVKKQKSLLKIIKTSDTKLIEDIISTNIIIEKGQDKISQNNVETTDKKAEAAETIEATEAATEAVTEEKTKKDQKSIEKMSKKNQIIDSNKIKKVEIDEVDDKDKDINMADKLIEKSILKEMAEEMKIEKIKKKEKKKGKEPCVSFIDCYFKSLDDNFYTSYKNDYTFIENAELPKEKNPVCKPQKDCDICYLNTSGVPESINYNSKSKTAMVNMPKNIEMKGNDNINVAQKEMKEMNNDYFKNNYEGLPDCPFDPCMSCDNNNKYKTIDNAFNNKLIEKYRVKK
jgi:hypothetical protein